ncbi:MAG: DUF4290 domain-containing protein [Saprospiraceae bacterium]|nr:DUF4290 domain-containing protein [Saprospiraceae bacterium]
MTYNSQKELLIIPEYGRNVQTLIRHAREIENLEERQSFVEEVVNLMMQMHPQNRNLDDYRTKMWTHVFRIADYDLPGVFPPNGIIPTPEDVRKQPDRIPYPKKETRYRHYGQNVQILINRALEMEPGPIKEGFVQVIGSYMKLAYRTWNKDTYVSDDVIVGDLHNLSNGKLELIEDASLDGLTQANKRRRRNTVSNKNDRDDRGRNNRGGRRRDSRGGGGRDRDGGGHRRRRR